MHRFDWRFVKPRAIAVGVLAAVSAAFAQPSEMGLIVFSRGEGHAPEQARWSLDVTIGKPLDISDTDSSSPRLVLGDIGIADAIADRAEGASGENGAHGGVREVG
jgi:hypothetical protein